MAGSVVDILAHPKERQHVVLLTAGRTQYHSSDFGKTYTAFTAPDAAGSYNTLSFNSGNPTAFIWNGLSAVRKGGCDSQPCCVNRRF